MRVNFVSNNENNSLNFKNFYVVDGMNGIQKSIAHNVSKKLTRVNKNGTSYLQEIKDRGYDVLVIKPELNDPNEVRLCVIKDMESCKLPDGDYDYLDAKPVCETGMHFSAEQFFNDFESVTAPKFKTIKSFFSKLFD